MKSRKYIHFLAKPEASYYLILTAVGLLTGLGLIMVLSASAVQSFQQSGSSYAIFLKQLLFVAIGVNNGRLWRPVDLRQMGATGTVSVAARRARTLPAIGATPR